MVQIPYFVAYFSIAIFLIAVVARFFMWAKMPMHLRWELYPVAHEGSRAHYGGSYYEESEWWKKKREVSLWGELKVMVPEILFLVALREHNLKLWTRSFPFHFGLYLVSLTTVLMMAGPLISKFLPGVAHVMSEVVPVIGAAGLGLGIIGALGLILRRLSREMRDYTMAADFINLIFFVIAFGVALVTFFFDPGFHVTSTFVANLVTAQLAPVEGSALVVGLVMASVVLLSLLLAYIPMTHMSHFVGKYFAYHAIRWNDEPNLQGGHIEPKIQEMLDQPITWAASHIQGDGKKTWLEAATEDIKE